MSLHAFLHPYPEAFLLGAQRSGTTYLHTALSRSPGIRNGVAKELHFFSLHWNEGPRAYHDRLPRRWPRWVYQARGRQRPIAIDATPLYLFDPEVPRRLVETVGTGGRFIVLLREPGARAWSQYQMMLSRGWEHLGFLEAVEREHERITSAAAFVPDEHSHSAFRHFSYIARGRYAEQLRRWWKLVPREQFLLLRSEDLFRTPETVIRQATDFLGLAPLALDQPIQQNSYHRSPLPAMMRQRLDEIFAEPNRELLELTGIGWNRPVPRTPRPVESAACS